MTIDTDSKTNANTIARAAEYLREQAGAPVNAATLRRELVGGLRAAGVDSPELIGATDFALSNIHAVLFRFRNRHNADWSEAKREGFTAAVELIADALALSGAEQ